MREIKVDNDQKLPVLTLDDNRTQEWLNRTRAFGPAGRPRRPAIRGGVEVDFAARRQSAALAGAVVLILFGLALIPRPRAPRPTALQAALPLASQDLTASTQQTPIASGVPRPVSAGGRVRAARFSRSAGSPLVNAWTPRDRIAPHAPVWVVMRPADYRTIQMPSDSLPGGGMPGAVAALPRSFNLTDR